MFHETATFNPQDPTGLFENRRAMWTPDGLQTLTLWNSEVIFVHFAQPAVGSVGTGMPPSLLPPQPSTRPIAGAPGSREMSRCVAGGSPCTFSQCSPDLGLLGGGRYVFISFFLFFFFTMWRGLLDLSSPTTDGTHAPCSESTES